MKEEPANINDPMLISLCRQEVATRIAHLGWQLVDQEQLTQLLLERMRERAVDGLEMGKTAVLRTQLNHCYSPFLYHACRQITDRARQNQAYSELHRYLYGIAHKHWPEYAEDAAQQALLLVAKQIENCKSPESFLSFAFFKLRQAFKQVVQTENRQEQLVLIASEEETTFTLNLERFEQKRCLQEALATLKEVEYKVVVWKYVFGLSDQEIADHLNMTPNAVSTRRNRTLKKLRQNQNLRNWFG